ncbi:GNAT family N-acetyltransferase [Rhodococcus ruber]|uniref:GNAT family N-acetyltransferase n=1 Tax=Rhodococcus ruber TaxID=1830 RepID=UPI001F1DC87C|nr:GNAT family protein [Rhodococcus ruber]MCF8785247.1 GNAT family N-acetyltransferase [Rhodococcus ruber]
MTVVLQALAEEHISQVLIACADWAELAPYGPPYWRPRSPAELRRKIAATSGPQPATEYSFVLAAADGELVGECSLHAIDWRNRVAQVGVCIWRRDERRHGYGCAAVQYMLDWGFGHLGLERIEAWIVEGNEPSLGLFRRLGFAHEATLRGRYLVAGKRRDMHIMGLLASA